MSRPLAVFRCDASPTLGGGHVARCRALATAMSKLGWRIAFAGSTGTDAIALDGDAARQADRLRDALPDGAALLVADHYGLDARFETACRGWAQRIVAIDDLCDRPHDCDLLIDSNADAAVARYRPLVPDDARLMLGPGVALLRDEFQRSRRSALARRHDDADARRVLLSFGSTDPRDATRSTLAALLPLRREIVLEIAIGGAAPALPLLRSEIDSGIALHVDSTDMAGLMVRADICIGAGGTTTWERCCLGLPTLLTTVADNQRPNAEALAARGAAIDLGDVGACAPAVLREAVSRLLRDRDARRAMSDAAAALCDGRGVQRVLLGLLTRRRLRDGRDVTLSLAEPADSATMLDWQQRPGIRRYTPNPQPPTDDEHAAWFASSLADPDRILTLIRVDTEAAGILRLDRRASSQSWEVSILVAPEHQGAGVGGAALALARALAPGVALDAAIHRDNAASRAMFARAGYTAVAAGLYRSTP